jgi:hypothetical protein
LDGQCLTGAAGRGYLKIISWILSQSGIDLTKECLTSAVSHEQTAG